MDFTIRVPVHIRFIAVDFTYWRQSMRRELANWGASLYRQKERFVEGMEACRLLEFMTVAFLCQRVYSKVF